MNITARSSCDPSRSANQDAPALGAEHELTFRCALHRVVVGAGQGEVASLAAPAGCQPGGALTTEPGPQLLVGAQQGVVELGRERGAFALGALEVGADLGLHHGECATGVLGGVE